MGTPLVVDVTAVPGTQASGLLIEVSAGSRLLPLQTDAIGHPGGLVLSAAGSVGEFQVGSHSLLSAQCISDVSLLSTTPVHDAALLGLDVLTMAANALHHAAGGSSMIEVSQLLVDALPKINAGLSGQLSQTELSSLISDVQGHLLNLTSQSNDMLGDLSGDVQSVLTAVEGLDANDLLASVSVDVNTLSDVYALSGVPEAHSAAHFTTLDALFTAPEAFPLTLDFSDARHVESATELFSANSHASGISSGASPEGSSFGGDASVFDKDFS